MKNHEPVAWMFDWTSPEVEKPYTSVSFSYPVDEQDVVVSHIRALYSEDYVVELLQFGKNLIAENAGLKNKIDNLLETLEAVVDEVEAIRLSGDCGYWEWDDEDPVSKAIGLITRLRESNEPVRTI